MSSTMSEDNKNDENTKSIPVLRRKHVKTVEVPVLKLDKGLNNDELEYRTDIRKAVTSALIKAIPSIIEDVLKQLENKDK